MPPAAVYFDEELEWVEEQIRLAEDGPMNPDPTPDMLQRSTTGSGSCGFAGCGRVCSARSRSRDRDVAERLIDFRRLPA
jgi:hypothetical protein